MEELLVDMVKLFVVFVGSIASILFSYYIGKEMIKIPAIMLKSNEKKDLKIKSFNKLSSKSGIYEVMFNETTIIKLFSSPDGIKIM